MAVFLFSLFVLVTLACLALLQLTYFSLPATFIIQQIIIVKIFVKTGNESRPGLSPCSRSFNLFTSLLLSFLITPDRFRHSAATCIHKTVQTDNEFCSILVPCSLPLWLSFVFRFLLFLTPCRLIYSAFTKSFVNTSNDCSSVLVSFSLSLSLFFPFFSAFFSFYVIICNVLILVLAPCSMPLSLSLPFFSAFFFFHFFPAALPIQHLFYTFAKTSNEFCSVLVSCSLSLSLSLPFFSAFFSLPSGRLPSLPSSFPPSPLLFCNYLLTACAWMEESN